MLWIALETLATISWIGSLVMGWDSLILPRQPKVVREIGEDWHVNEFVGNFCCHPFEGYNHKSPKVNHSSSCGDTKIMVKHAPRVTPFHHLWSFENICQETHQERHDLGWKIIYPCSPNKTGKIWNYFLVAKILPQATQKLYMFFKPDLSSKNHGSLILGCELETFLQDECPLWHLWFRSVWDILQLRPPKLFFHRLNFHAKDLQNKGRALLPLSTWCFQGLRGLCPP